MDRRGFSLIIVLLVVAAVIAGGIWYWQWYRAGIIAGNAAPNLPAGTEQWATYKNEQYGFEMKYPSDESIQDTPGYKWDAFNICKGQSCKEVMEVWNDASSPPQGMHVIALPPGDAPIFYYYGVNSSDPEIDQVLATVQFLPQGQ